MTARGREYRRFPGSPGCGGLLRCLVLALALATGAAANELPKVRAEKPRPAVTGKLMPDGREWMVKNLALETDGSSCYAGQELNCRLYGRLYSLEGARRACAALDQGWRLPTDAEWRGLTASVGGGGSAKSDRKAYEALTVGGAAGFDAVLGGRRAAGGEYAGRGAQGFYWAEPDHPGRADGAGQAGKAAFHELRREGATLARHDDGDPRMALSVRCVRSFGTDAR